MKPRGDLTVNTEKPQDTENPYEGNRYHMSSSPKREVDMGHGA